MKNKFALIGYTGFIGSNLLKFRKSIDKYNSKNISSIKHNNYEIVICAGTSSKRWLANKFPKKDKKNISNLIKNIQKMKTKKFILISTCEVYGTSNKSSEKNIINIRGKTNYSKNRIFLENFCKNNFQNLYIIRLPIVYGQNFSKNFIYDLLKKNDIHKLNGKDKVQIYHVKNLLGDINFVLKKNIKSLNISSPPIEMGFISKNYFNIKLKESNPFRKMNMKTIYSKNNSDYYISKEKTLKDLKFFLKKGK